MDQLNADLLVIGGGMAGLSAGAAAAQAGARVVLLESSTQLGGSAALSGACIWTAPTLKEFRLKNPLGEPSLAKLIVGHLSEGMDWLQSIGVDMGPMIPVLGFGRGRQVDMEGYIRRCAAMICSTGEVDLDVHVRSLVRSGSGRVVGAYASGHSRDLHVAARDTVLATGGFQGNPDMRARYIHRNARDMLVRSNSASRGGGLRLARQVGASTSPFMDGFYGHLICSPVRHWGPNEYSRLSQHQSNLGILINVFGDRFTDESAGDHYNAQATVRQPERRAILLIDERVRRLHMGTTELDGTSSVDRFQVAADVGARYGQASSLKELAKALTAWSIDAAAFLRTVLRYNSGVLLPDEPPRRIFHNQLVEPPFHALEVQPAITFTHGGLSIDDHARALDPKGRPIPGLFAAGADAGGVYERGYVGGLAVALVLGRRAAATAVGDSV